MAENSFMRNFEEKLSGDSPFASILSQLEHLTGLSRIQIIVILVTLLLTAGLFFGNVGKFMCFIVGLVYPAYCSWQAIESQNQEDKTRWLTYWVVYACFSVGTFFTDVTFNPFFLYWSLKLVFLVWCVLPVSFNGTGYLYGNFIRPYFSMNAHILDDVANTIETTINEHLR